MIDEGKGGKFSGKEGNMIENIFRFIKMNLTSILAVWGAFLSTIALIWNITRDYPKLKKPKLKILPLNPDRDIKKYEYPLHWADIKYTFLTDTAQPIDIHKKFKKRLDVAFTCKDQKFPGCWIAIPFALKSPSMSQGYLPPGKYEIEIEILCANGKGDKKKYTIFSPQEWDKLNITEL